MIRLPLLRRLDIDDYGLYPGQTEEPGLHVVFEPGLTLAIGANGLGKTTLITILYRLLTGPSDLRAIETRSELGGTPPELRELNPYERALFARRVLDAASSAKARLTFALGQSEFVIERQLKDLQLVSLQRNGETIEPSEATFRSEVEREAVLSSFEDWILLLRYLVFYLEERRALVWDSSAQKQIIRTLLFPPEEAGVWAKTEEELEELGSAIRNLRYVANREERRLSQLEAAFDRGDVTIANLAQLESVQLREMNRRNEISDSLTDLDANREEARLARLRLEQAVDSTRRDLERATLQAIHATFPSSDASSRYILTHLLVDGICLVCGNEKPDVQASLRERSEEGLCVVCGSELGIGHTQENPTLLAGHAVESLRDRLSELSQDSEATEAALREATEQYDAAVLELRNLEASIAGRQAVIKRLSDQLPPEQARLRAQRDETRTWRSSLAEQEAEFAEKRNGFANLIENASATVVSRSNAISSAFEHYATQFLRETCTMVWAPHSQQVGQMGQQIAFPAFGIEMTGVDPTITTRRAGPDQVSESQREFIDLAFRMALIEIASDGGAGTLVIDAPESSLDRVFAERAAQVLSSFASRTTTNRLVITSNLVEGSLLPNLLRSVSGPNAISHVVNLFALAEPTAAIRADRDEYDSAMRELLLPLQSQPTDGADRSE